jgi:sucrose-6F-phosphate phosphohydrolase
MMINKLFLCSDLDRTLLPNGWQDESPKARKLLHVIARHPEITLAYVSGRNQSLLLEAITTYEIPVPEYAVGDVGTTIYHITDNQWVPSKEWENKIALDWKGCRHDQISDLFKDISEIELQEPDNQNTYKVSYYAPADLKYRPLMDVMQARLRTKDVKASLIWSVDQGANQGLIDILPENATKYHAIRFLMQHNNFSETSTVFAGDSGNDLPVLTSGLQAVLVHNATEDVRREARQKVALKGQESKLYCAKGGFLNMNGNYAAGVIEGLVHFIPKVASWLS